MAKAKISPSQFNASFQQLDKMFIERIDKIEDAMRKSMDKMANEAKRNAPIGVLGPHPGRLADSIEWEEPSKLSYRLVANAPYAAYVEFGTGKYFKPKDEYWDSIAKQFFVNGKGTTVAQPFFYPAVNKELPKLIERIKKILSKNA